MKIYIVGSVASGKTTFSKKLSNVLGIPCTHLDGIVHIKDKTNKEWGNIRRCDDEIKEMFSQLINKQQWIIEDAGRKSFREGMEKAEVIINLQPSILIRKKRIITRYIKQKIGLEDCLYRPSLRMLKFMFRALYDYETGRNDLDLRLNQYRDKTITLRNSRDTEEYILNVTK